MDRNDRLGAYSWLIKQIQAGRCSRSVRPRMRNDNAVLCAAVRLLPTALARKIVQSVVFVCLFALCLLNRLTFDLNFLYVYGMAHEYSKPGIEQRGRFLQGW